MADPIQIENRSNMRGSERKREESLTDKSTINGWTNTDMDATYE